MAAGGEIILSLHNQGLGGGSRRGNITCPSITMGSGSRMGNVTYPSVVYVTHICDCICD